MAADPKAQVLIDWTENWSDFDGAAKLTEEQIRKGADVVYATANTGVITAADKYPAVKIIGALVDVSSLSKNVAASVVINTDVVYRHFIKSIADGTFRSGVYNASAADGVWSVVGRKSP
jgi:basic membrane lipoprotein Med (substrate-binding protein (PBP1-ABC) superfamily)